MYPGRVLCFLTFGSILTFDPPNLSSTFKKKYVADTGATTYKKTLREFYSPRLLATFF